MRSFALFSLSLILGFAIWFCLSPGGQEAQAVVGTAGGAGISRGDATNIARAVMGSTTPTNPPLVNSFVFIGSSLTAEASSKMGIGLDWPQMLLQQPNYAIHGPSYNFGLAGSTAAGWVASTWATTAATVAPAVSNRTWIFMEFGVNDYGSTTITNDLNTLWSSARASNYYVVALTVATNSNLSSAALRLWWTNINLYIISASNRWDRVVDVGSMLTNGATQLYDGIHWTNLFHQQFVTYLNTNLPPPLSSNWIAYNQSFSSPIFSTVTATNAARLNAIVVNGNSTTAGDSLWNGSALHMYHDGNTAQFLSQSYDVGVGTYKDMNLSAANVIFAPHSGGRVVINGGILESWVGGAIYADSSNTCVIIIGNSVSGGTASAKSLGLKNDVAMLAIRFGDDSAYAPIKTGFLHMPTNTAFAAPTVALGGCVYGQSNGVPYVWYNTNNTTVAKALVP